MTRGAGDGAAAGAGRQPDTSAGGGAPRVLAADPAAVDAAGRVLAGGGLVVYPTETLYGLGADATDAGAVDRLVAVRGREAGKPIALLVADTAMVDAVARSVSAAARRLMARFWPGPLTLVLDARPGLPAPLTAGTDSIGVRVSSHPVARGLVRALGRPLTTPSANPPGAPSPRDVTTALGYFGARVDLYLDGGPLPGEPASTVVDVRAGARIVRAGAVPAEAVFAELGIRPPEPGDR